ncbi:MAG: T9SS type A sorting domain-containing protein [Flavobacteriales bacterium]|nr:T9SS type A sorting domain-containing protein [Flavobacteriales bacterium]MCB9363613.1 T9SS type A sorting domain-containing protein [Flavobacteriales bacterium]
MAVNGMGQTNLVPNPSFEDYSLCPDSWAQIDRINNWEAYKGSPDYFNSCEPTNSFSTPQNLMGNQSPASGDSYAALIFYSRDGINADEIMGVQLSQSLSIGTKYYISFRIVLKYNNPFGVCCANNKIGAKFSTQSYTTSNPPVIDNNAHVWTDSVISDTLNWNLIFGSFTADSTYNYLMIGNFFTNPNIIINDIIPANDFGYYYVDDVCVSTDSSYTANYIYTGVEEEYLKDKFNIYPNPVNGYFYINQSSTEPYDLIIHNTLGQKLYEEKNINSNSKLINSTQYTKGLLIINIKSKNTSITYKLLNP